MLLLGMSAFILVSGKDVLDADAPSEVQNSVSCFLGDSGEKRARGTYLS